MAAVAVPAHRRRRAGPPLELGASFGFPFRQEVRVPADDSLRAESVAEAVLRADGFDTATIYGLNDRSGTPSVQYWIGERGLRRRNVTSSTAIVPIIAVFVVGSILGGLDAYILGSPVVGLFWVAGAAAASLVFWLRFGGTYDSDLVMVSVVPSVAGSSLPGSTVPVVFWAARVRSQKHADVREPLVVSGPLKLAAELGTVVHRFEAEISSPDSPPTGAGSPAVRST